MIPAVQRDIFYSINVKYMFDFVLAHSIQGMMTHWYPKVHNDPDVF